MVGRLSVIGRRLCFAITVSLWASSVLTAQESKPVLQPEDLYLFESAQALTPLPDLKSAVYVRRWIEPLHGQEKFSLWRIDSGPERRTRALEAEQPDARLPVVSPDGQWIAIRTTREHPAGMRWPLRVPLESEPATDIWLVTADGSRSLPLTGLEKPYGRVFSDPFYSRVAFSPDGKRLVFVADDGRDPRGEAEILHHVTRVRPDQGEGYTGYGPAQIWIADLDFTQTEHAAARVQRLTEDETWYGDPQWMPDGTAVICHANKSEDVESVRFSINKNFDLWQIDVTTGEQKQLTNAPGPDVSPRVSPDGLQVAYLTVPRKGPHADIYNLAILNRGATSRRSGVLHDHHTQPDNPPHPSPSFPLPDRVWNGDTTLVYNTFHGVLTEMVKLDLTTGKGSDFVAEAPEEKSSLIAQHIEAIRALAPPAPSLTRERTFGEDRLISWRVGELDLQGIITYPPIPVGKAPYPLIVFPHGGPHSRSTLGFNMTAHMFAAQGFLVFQPNFRGSSGYGKTFLDLDRHDLGGGDMNDILAGIETLIGEGLVDRNRQYVYGVSYGGFMTTWLVGHTNQFRAAVAQNAVTHMDVMWGLSDIQSWTEWELGGKPWDVPEMMDKHSPYAHVKNVQTPTLILHSRDDRRCPIAMGRMFHQALQARGVPTEMVIYPDEGHGIKQPIHQVDVLKRTIQWFRRFDPVFGVEIVTLGDSITKGSRPGVRQDQTFAARLERTLLDRGHPVRVTNVGIGGERTDQALARLERDVIARKPRIVTIMYGTNDSYVDQGKSDSRITAEQYRDNLQTIIAKLKDAGIQPVLMTEPRWGKTATPNGAGEHPNLRLEKYLDECRTVAKELKVPLVDHYTHWSTAENEGQVLGAWTTDQCHPNAAGHRILMETMLPVVENAVRTLPPR